MEFKQKNGTVIDLLTDNDVYNLELGTLSKIENDIYKSLEYALKNLSQEIKDKISYKNFMGSFTYDTLYTFIGCYNPYSNGYFSILALSHRQNSLFHMTIVDGSLNAYTLASNKVI